MSSTPGCKVRRGMFAPTETSIEHLMPSRVRAEDEMSAYYGILDTRPAHDGLYLGVPAPAV